MPTTLTSLLAELGTLDPRLTLGLGAVGMFVAMSLLRLLRSVRRMIWTAALLTTAGGVGAGSGWAVLDALRLWH